MARHADTARRDGIQPRLRRRPAAEARRRPHPARRHGPPPRRRLRRLQDQGPGPPRGRRVRSPDFSASLLGFKWKDMERGIVDSIHKAMPAILIMLSVGILVGSWMASGTIPMVIYYGLKLISPKFFLATACLVCSVVVHRLGDVVGDDRHGRRRLHRHRHGPRHPPRPGGRGGRRRGLLRRQDVAPLRHPQPGHGHLRVQPLRPHQAHDVVGRARPGWPAWPSTSSSA